MKNEYSKLTFFKVWVHVYKSNKKLRVINKVLPNSFCQEMNCRSGGTKCTQFDHLLMPNGPI